MAVILPGQEFTITFGGGQTVRVKALSGREQQQKFAPLFQAVIEAERVTNVTESVTASKALLDYMVGEDRANQLWDSTVDAGMVMEIARKLLERGRLDEDEVKN